MKLALTVLLVVVGLLFSTPAKADTLVGQGALVVAVHVVPEQLAGDQTRTIFESTVYVPGHPETVLWHGMGLVKDITPASHFGQSTLVVDKVVVGPGNRAQHNTVVLRWNSHGYAVI